jgi:hypothetical protein
MTYSFWPSGASARPPVASSRSVPQIPTRRTWTLTSSDAPMDGSIRSLRRIVVVPGIIVIAFIDSYSSSDILPVTHRYSPINPLTTIQCNMINLSTPIPNRVFTVVRSISNLIYHAPSKRSIGGIGNVCLIRQRHWKSTESFVSSKVNPLI